MKKECDCIGKLEKLLKEYQSVMKNRHRKNSTAQCVKLSDFMSKLDDLFDIAGRAVNAKNLEDKDAVAFLKAQREKGRPGNLKFVVDTAAFEP